jgi:hypothetical protein
VSARSRTPSALLAVRGRLDPVRRWAERGLLPVWLVPDVAWTLVVPAGDAGGAADAGSPYDDPVTLLGGRPLPSALRPSLLLVADPERAVLVVHDRARRAEQRWLVWVAGAGAQRVDELPYAPPAAVAQLCGLDPRDAGLRAALADDARRPVDVVDDLLRALRLPGAGLPLGAVRAEHLPGAVLVEPDARVVDRFTRHVQHEAHLAAQLEDPR